MTAGSGARISEYNNARLFSIAIFKQTAADNYTLYIMTGGSEARISEPRSGEIRKPPFDVNRDSCRVDFIFPVLISRRPTERHSPVFPACKRKGTIPNRLIRQKVGSDSEAL